MNKASKMYTPSVILVTGGAGFIGANYILNLRRYRPDVRIVNLDKLTYAGNAHHLEPLANDDRYRFVQGDICDQRLVGELMRAEQIDCIVHFAAESHVDRSITGPSEFIQTNLFGTFALLEAARHYWLEEMDAGETDCRFHHVSTDEVYGSLGADDPAFDEAMPYRPNSPYSASKAGSDHLVRAYRQTYALPVVTTHCSNNYGPFQHAEKLIPTVIRSCYSRAPIPVYGDGSNVRDWLYVGDHCAALLDALEKGETGETYNIGGGVECSNLELVRRICSLMDERRPANAPHEDLISLVADRPGHDWRYAIDSSKLKRHLGWQPLVGIDAGLRETLAWYLDSDDVECRLGLRS